MKITTKLDAKGNVLLDVKGNEIYSAVVTYFPMSAKDIELFAEALTSRYGNQVNLEVDDSMMSKGFFKLTRFNDLYFRFNIGQDVYRSNPYSYVMNITNNNYN